MTLLTFTCLLLSTAFLAGLIGALTGLGGGVILIPTLVIFLKVNLYYALGSSLISVIASSSVASITFMRQGLINLRIAMFLETAAIIGALIGAALVLILHMHLIAIIFGIVLLISAYLTWTRDENLDRAKTSHPWATLMQLDGTYPVLNEMKPYYVQHVPLAWIIMLIAGILSSLLGIGSGALKVLAMDQTMGLPYKVSAATSNFMIGITAAVGVGIYFSRGYIDPAMSCSVVIGVFIGAAVGAKLLLYINVKFARLLFGIIIILLALQMIYKGLYGEI